MRKFSNIDNEFVINHELSLPEAYVLEWMLHLPIWADKIIVSKITIYFASKNKACEDLPMITKKKDTMYRYYKRLEEKELIRNHKVSNKDFIEILPKCSAWNSVRRLDDHPLESGQTSEQTTDELPTNSNSINSNSNSNLFDQAEIDSIPKEVLKKCLIYFPEDLKPKGKQIEKWEMEIEKIIRIDKVNPDKLIAIVKWVRNDNFWKKNFISIMKLRKTNKEGVKYHIVFSQQFKPLNDGSHNFKFEPSEKAQLI